MEMLFEQDKIANGGKFESVQPGEEYTHVQKVCGSTGCNWTGGIVGKNDAGGLVEASEEWDTHVASTQEVTYNESGKVASRIWHVCYDQHYNQA
ncbi:hypothetical protein A2875_03650 [Candidatus Gottesmanbacteria bacterium RIFCSPHIGHO2_01_FULL_46_14]|uniref:Uncharacterized protein n=1 Tax=Candidatus Gottesmanbacteria bacterium RIFCSPHIGHO2_01_FULL_46_14 TaxID=1798380 RepID=A0A1F5ZN23_9BACT|nr:MAG: hypothetical protein A2875_03650 [Candidatus Gottesmanbacteria bacterium RIFCSPHIGHO2_01_FULL_46_14]